MTNSEIQVLENYFKRKIDCHPSLEESFTSGLLEQLLGKTLDQIDCKYGENSNKEDVKWIKSTLVSNFLITFLLLSKLHKYDLESITPIKLNNERI